MKKIKLAWALGILCSFFSMNAVALTDEEVKQIADGSFDLRSQDLPTLRNLLISATIEFMPNDPRISDYHKARQNIMQAMREKGVSSDFYHSNESTRGSAPVPPPTIAHSVSSSSAGSSMGRANEHRAALNDSPLFQKMRAQHNPDEGK